MRSEPELPQDTCHRFLFDEQGIRGEVVHLSASLEQALSMKQYPPALASLLGEALVAAALLADTIKMEGSLILQVQGDGPVQTLVAQATDNGELRGMVHYTEYDESVVNFRELVGQGRMVITIDATGSERYQGVVSIEGDSLAESIDAYFAQSEQLPTRIWLSADSHQAGGLLLQQLADIAPENDQWNHLTTITETITRRELAELPTNQLLNRLYHQEQVRLFEPTYLRFHCGCSRSKIEAVLVQLGQMEIQQIIEEDGEVSVECEFCNQTYAFDPIDVTSLFVSTIQSPPLHQ